MASADAVIDQEPDFPLTNPWPWMWAGLGATLTAFFWVQLLPETATWVPPLLVLGGVVTAGAAVTIRPASAPLLGCAGLVALIGGWALFFGDGSSWIFFRVLFDPDDPVQVLARERIWDGTRIVLALVALFAWFGALVFAGLVALGAPLATQPASPPVRLCAGLVAVLGAGVLFLTDLRRAIFGVLANPAPRPVDPEALAAWDSIRMVLVVAALVAGVAALIVLLPRFWRRAAVSLLVALHFLGILSIVISAPPGPWAWQVPHTYFYRYYLDFMNLNNPYRFYAPDPGPAFILWFHVEYKENGAVNRYLEKVPDLDDNGWPQYSLAIRYQRRLALASLVSSDVVQANAAEFSDKFDKWLSYNHDRAEMGQPQIPHYPEVAIQTGQFLRPTLFWQMYLESYVRHLAHDFQDKHPLAEIRGIKVYRVEHRWLTAGQFVAGLDPNDPSTYSPYFWGDYDVHGRLKDADDPTLGWWIPLIRVKASMVRTLIRSRDEDGQVTAPGVFQRLVLEATKIRPDQDAAVLNYVRLHAGEKAWIRFPGNDQYEAP
jgi:hypothetical protein